MRIRKTDRSPEKTLLYEKNIIILLTQTFY